MCTATVLLVGACAEVDLPSGEALPPPPIAPAGSAEDAPPAGTVAVAPAPASGAAAADPPRGAGSVVDPGPVDASGGAVSLSAEERREERLRSFRTFDADNDPSVQSVGIVRRRGWTALKF
ncbi:MAG: hypothetical protein AAF882_00700 [Pseudomonadota bacterium]